MKFSAISTALFFGAIAAPAIATPVGGQTVTVTNKQTVFRTQTVHDTVRIISTRTKTETRVTTGEWDSFKLQQHEKKKGHILTFLSFCRDHNKHKHKNKDSICHHYLDCGQAHHCDQDCSTARPYHKVPDLDCHGSYHQVPYSDFDCHGSHHQLRYFDCHGSHHQLRYFDCNGPYHRVRYFD
jgi:Pyruvate/2-oxoacid:ferredoxin oxidoreductase delta subunit